MRQDGVQTWQYDVQTTTSTPRTKKPHNTIPFNVAKHLSIPQKLGEVDVKHVTWLLEHDVVVMAITNPKDVGRHTVSSTGVHEVLNCLRKQSRTETKAQDAVIPSGVILSSSQRSNKTNLSAPGQPQNKLISHWSAIKQTDQPLARHKTNWLATGHHKNWSATGQPQNKLINHWPAVSQTA